MLITYLVQLTIWSRSSTLNEWKSASFVFSISSTTVRTGRQVVVKIRVIIATRLVEVVPPECRDFLYLNFIVKLVAIRCRLVAKEPKKTTCYPLSYPSPLCAHKKWQKHVSCLRIKIQSLARAEVLRMAAKCGIECAKYHVSSCLPRNLSFLAKIDSWWCMCVCVSTNVCECHARLNSHAEQKCGPYHLSFPASSLLPLWPQGLSDHKNKINFI